MAFLLAGLVVVLGLAIMSGDLVPRRELEAVRTFREQLEDEPVRAVAPRPVLDYDLAYGVRTHAEVFERLPQWMRADFDCPDHGAHDFLPRVTSRENHYEWCRHCNRMKREVDEWPSTERDPLDVIYSLQFSR